MPRKVRYFQIDKYEAKFSIVFHIRPASKHGSMGGGTLDGLIESQSREEAATTMKTIVTNALAQAGFKEKTE